MTYSMYNAFYWLLSSRNDFVPELTITQKSVISTTTEVNEYSKFTSSELLATISTTQTTITTQTTENTGVVLTTIRSTEVTPKSMVSKTTTQSTSKTIMLDSFTRRSVKNGEFYKKVICFLLESKSLRS